MRKDRLPRMVFALLDGPLGGKNYLHGVAGGGARHPRAVLDFNGPTSERGGRTSPVGGDGGELAADEDDCVSYACECVRLAGLTDDEPVTRRFVTAEEPPLYERNIFDK